jgi:hypothetical protein
MIEIVEAESLVTDELKGESMANKPIYVAESQMPKALF